MQRLIAALLASLTIGSLCGAQEIALINPGFEQAAENDPTLPADWIRWQAGPEQAHLDSGDPFEGQSCAALRPNPPGRGTVVLKQYFTDYQPGQTYEVAFAGRTNG
ncbi:MAG TPA: hypothetical protein VM283_07310, partial [Armatimonadota bacterium]|nr:hypothetical protein [Armatimonadota bacterium]